MQKYEKTKKKTYLVDKKDIETIAYADETEEDLIRGESMLEATNKVLDFEEFKRQQEEAIKNFNENNFNKNKRKAKNSEKDIFNSIKKVYEKRQSSTNSNKENIKKVQETLDFGDGRQ